MGVAKILSVAIAGLKISGERWSIVGVDKVGVSTYCGRGHIVGVDIVGD